MTVTPFHNLSSRIKYDFFFKCTYSFSEMDLLVLQTNALKMPAVRDESDQEISWDMFEDGLNFLPLNFLGIFCICTARGSWNKPIFNIRHFETCKLSITLQRLPPSHTPLWLKVYTVKLFCIVKRRKINGISWICLRAKVELHRTQETHREMFTQTSAVTHLLTSSWPVWLVMTSYFVCFPLNCAFSCS